ncbi:ATPase family AAA domain-containing protein 2-like [Thrips palmi]|uniref:ATPase family AAA domain-containing protein 2-like n=1 Tax=Thrips palmi TaxID=161013 RepID=A0A6P8YP90_THRPL|nr:ATPase family AAA domain-containing protein 2-like [Thrips palmi]
MVQTRRKDDTSFSNEPDLRRSTRETRVLRFKVSDNDDDEDERTSWSGKVRRHPTRVRRATLRYSSSLSMRSRGHVDGSETDDESHSDDSIFDSRRSRSSRTVRRVSRSSRRRSGDHVDTSTDHIDMGLEEDLAHQEDEGVRRSTRQRNHPSWLIGTQTLRGYPSYDQNPKEPSSVEKASNSRGNRSRDGDHSSQESPQVAGPSLRSQRSVKLETKEDTESEEEPEKSEEKKDAEEMEVEPGPKENGDDASSEEENEEVPGSKKNSRRTKKRGDKVSPQNENFPDMYSRVKRVRRQTKRFSYPISHSRGFSRDGEMMSQTQSSSGSDDSDSDQPSRRSSLRQDTRRTYQLRVNKPTVDRFQAEPVRRPPRSFQKALCNSVLRHLGRRSTSRFAPNVSSSSSDDGQARFDHKKTHSRHHHPKDAAKVAGHHLTHSKDGKPATLADIDPMALDTSIRFQAVGGLEEHIKCLQEMVVFPMLYKDVFDKFHITPPKGVLFHGPPGTGKTLIARALANECSQGDRKVSFFMRKGADCLSKWVGESERQLRLLFEQAYQMKPSIIFFDEIDGLAPVRSSKQDQIHASIVSTLLALMDGLDSRGDVIVIGATNRVDAIDPALRRPGRFDRELYFPLPACKERQEILKIHVNKWDNKPDPSVISKLAEQSSGYCGSDLRALCAESVIQALRRTYPQIYKSNQRLLLDANKVQVACEDFTLAQSSIVPAAHRVSPSPASKLPVFLEPLLSGRLESIITQMKDIFPHGLSRDKNKLFVVHQPRLMIVGPGSDYGQTTHLAPALLHHMEHIPVYTLDLGSMYEVSARSPEETVSQVFQEARRNPPSVVYLPSIGQWWEQVPHTVQSIFLLHLQKLDMSSPVFLLATSDGPDVALPTELKSVFSGYRDEIFTVKNPSNKERESFFSPLILQSTLLPPKPPKLTEETWEELPVAPPPEPAKLTDEDLAKLYAKEEHTLRELRIFLREVCAKLARNRLFFMFTKPVDVEEAPDYYDIIEKPMDLETMMTRIDKHDYVCAKEFLDDIDLICRNALEYNPDRDQADKLIRHRACFLKDTAYALIKAEMDSDFEDRCRSISSDRKKRKDSPSRYAPAPEFIHTTSSAHKNQGTNGNKDGPARLVNGDVSSHSSVASNNGAVPNGPLSSRKRRPSSWSRGFISKPKKKKLSEDHPQEKQDTAVESVTQRAGSAPPSSPPPSPTGGDRSHTPTDLSSRHSSDVKETAEKTEVDNAKFASMNGSCETHSDDDMDQTNLPDSKGPDNKRCRDSKSPIRPDRESPKTRRTSSECSKPTARNSTSPTEMKKEVTIDTSDLEKLLTSIVIATKDCHVKSLTELYIRLEKKISSFSDKWDRSSLPQVLRGEIERFKVFMKPS